MKILIIGIDGYIGYALAKDILSTSTEHTVTGIDSLLRRKMVKKIGSDSITPIAEPSVRNKQLFKYAGYRGTYFGTIMNYPFLREALSNCEPDVIVHLGEQPSAPYSMIGSNEAYETQFNNVLGTLNLIWLLKELDFKQTTVVKLGTMGEYGTPSTASFKGHIPEGFIPEKCISTRRRECPLGGLPFPKLPWSFYHISKCQDSLNLKFASDLGWFKTIDIMQGVVSGLFTSDCDITRDYTRLDYDYYFGTIIHRFCAQAVVGHPLTIYGKGFQVRSFLSLKDSIKCIKLIINNLSKFTAQYEVVNQFGHIHGLNGIARTVASVAMEHGFKVNISHLRNIRMEVQSHYYKPSNDKLKSLGYEPSPLYDSINETISVIKLYKDRIDKELFIKNTMWR